MEFESIMFMTFEEANAIEPRLFLLANKSRLFIKWSEFKCFGMKDFNNNKNLPIYTEFIRRIELRRYALRVYFHFGNSSVGKKNGFFKTKRRKKMNGQGFMSPI